LIPAESYSTLPDPDERVRARIKGAIAFESLGGNRVFFQLPSRRIEGGLGEESQEL